MYGTKLNTELKPQGALINFNLENNLEKLLTCDDEIKTQMHI